MESRFPGSDISGRPGPAGYVREFQISGGAGWLDTERYDIVAKGGDGAGVSDDEIRKMTDEGRDAFKAQFLLKLQMLLADRFQLKVHRETKELPDRREERAYHGAEDQ